MLIPTPQQCEWSEGALPLAGRLSITAQLRDSFAAETLIDALREELGVDASLEEVDGSIRLQRVDDPRCHELLGDIPESALSEAYALDVTPASAWVYAHTDAGMFYGVQTLIQLVRMGAPRKGIPSCRIVDWPAFRYRGWQDDISRGPIPTLAHLKRQVRTLAHYKLNLLTLYTEHVFKLKRHPTLAPSDGITAEEIRELVAYARPYHVEIAGNFQSFGHFQHILSQPGYEAMGEAGRVISPAREESYQFLSEVFSEIAPAYESPLFNINCDETQGLGQGASRALVERFGVGEVYARHIARVANLLAPHRKTLMMWGDIALHHPEIPPRLPPATVILTWGYDPLPDYTPRIAPFARLGFRFLVCPGVQCWKRLYPDLAGSLVNISNFTRDGARLGASGMLNTTWDDDGENLFACNWPGLLWGAECAWRPLTETAPETAEQERARRFDIFAFAYDLHFHGQRGLESLDALRVLDRLRDEPALAGFQTELFWRSPLESAAQFLSPEAAQALHRLAQRAERVCERLGAARSDARRNADTLEAALLAARRVRLVTTRLSVTLALTRRDAETDQALGDLIEEARDLRRCYAECWQRENRASSLDRVLARYDALLEQLETLPLGALLAPPEDGLFTKVEVSVVPLGSAAEIRLSLDGSPPGLQSPRYRGPFELTTTTTVSIRGFDQAGRCGQASSARYVVFPAAARIVTTLETNKEHAPQRAFDPDPQRFFWSRRELREGDIFGLELPGGLAARHARVVTGHESQPYHILHAGVLEGAYDGRGFTPLTTFVSGVADVSLDGRPLRALRLRATAPQAFWLIVRQFEIM